MSIFYNVSIALIIVIVLFGIAGYALTLLAYLISNVFNIPAKPVTFFTMVTNNAYGMVGLPVAAIVAFVVTVLLNINTPVAEMTFKFFGLDFHGPAVPLTLWILCFLSIVSSMRIIKGLDT